MSWSPKRSRRRAAIRRFEILETRALLALAVPIYHSNPGADATLYLDFDGHHESAWGGFTNAASPIYNTDNDFSDFSTAELGEMLSIARRVAKDFAPFNIDVTTELPADQSHGQMLRIVIGGTTHDWFSIQSGRSAGGFALFDSFTQSSVPNTVYVFINQQDVFFPDTLLARVASHEAGHGFGLQHQSDWRSDHQLINEYSLGNGVWMPVMGDSSGSLSTWANGASILGYDQFQDDMAMISRPVNGFGYRPDDFGNTRGAARALTVDSNKFSTSGVIAQNEDVDYFSFTTSGGATMLRVNPTGWDPNLVPVMDLYSSGGTLITSTTPTPDQAGPAYISRNLAAGTYYVAIRSNGDYGRVGQYTFSGNLAAGTNAAPVVSAGPDQTVPQSSYVVLKGSYVDDGLPIPPKTVNTTWTKRSGPGVVTFWSTAYAETVASFSAPGIYVLRLTANDGSTSRNDEVTITVAASGPSNRNPSVEAGPDLTTLVTSQAVLDGTVTDDGLPNPPASVTTNWSVAAGPGNVVFANASAIDTTATFSQAGTYHLRLTATDGQSTHFDQIQVTVNDDPSVNHAPNVDAGQDQQVETPFAISINGMISDDGLPNPPAAFTTAWSQVSGPGTANIADPSSRLTTVTFSAVGTYVMRLTANDGELLAFDELTVVVTPGSGMTEVSLQLGVNGYTGMIDATLKSGSPTSNSGSAVVLDAHGNPDKAAVLQWNLSTIPAGSSVQAASITLHVTNETDNSYEFYEVLKAWTESGVTWTNAASGAAWSSPGAQAVGMDRGSAILGAITSGGLEGFFTVELTSAGVALIQKWINTPSTNHGIIVQNYANGDGLSFDSSEASSTGVRPKLTIVYSTDTQSPANQAPNVNAGIDQTITAGSSAALDGIATDDGLPNPPAQVTTAWSKTSGPGTVTFGNASVVDTTAAFSASGTYVLRLTASDGQVSAFDELTVVVTPGSETTVSLQQGVGGYTGMIDSTLKSGSPTSNSGSAVVLDAHGNPDKAAILKWSLTTIPAGSIIQSASITLHVTNESNNSYEFYEVLKPWTESSVSWTNATSGTAWSLPGAQAVGADRGSTILGAITSNGLEGFFTFNLTSAGVALIQQWINAPSTNHGIIVQNYANGDGLSFDSSEASNTAVRPTLTIAYQTSAGAPAAQQTGPAGAASADSRIVAISIDADGNTPEFSFGRIVAQSRAIVGDSINRLLILSDEASGALSSTHSITDLPGTTIDWAPPVTFDLDDARSTLVHRATDRITFLIARMCKLDHKLDSGLLEDIDELMSAILHPGLRSTDFAHAVGAIFQADDWSA